MSKKIKKADKANKVKIKKKKRAFKIKPIYLTIIIGVSVAIFSAFLNAQLSNLDKTIIAQQSEINELKKTKQSLEGEIKGIKSSKEIQEEAMYKLGMVYPQESQVVYVDVSKNKINKDVNNNVFLSPIISVLKSFTKN